MMAEQLFILGEKFTQVPLGGEIVKCAHKTVFPCFLWKYSFFEKNVEYKNIQHLISDRKSYINFWCKMIPDKWHSDPAAVLQTK